MSASLVIVVLITAAAVYLLDHRNQVYSATIVPTSTTAPSPTATMQPLQVTAVQGWVNPSALSFGKDIQFAPSNPLTGYVCGNTTAIAGNDPLLFTVTHDGGRTWSTPQVIPQTQTDAACHLSINPTNANDVYMDGYTCWQGCGDGGISYHRTFDSGTTWQEVLLPTGDPSYTLLGGPVWVGKDLFLTAYQPANIGGPDTTAITHNIAISIDSAPLTWVNQSGLSAILGQVNAGQINVGVSYAIGSNYYVHIYDTGGEFLAHTNDRGANWLIEHPKGIGRIVGNSGVVIDQAHRIIYSGDSYSSDGEQTWQTVPNLPSENNAVAIYINAMTSDGTFFSSVIKQNAISLYKREVGAKIWQLVDPDARISGIITVSTNLQGIPQAIWSMKLSSKGQFVPGLIYHAP